MTLPPAGWSDHPAALALAGRHRLRAWEPIPWVLALGFYFAFPKHLGFGTELLVTILFAISLDLVLGYAGIVTLGHAAFFGAGAYTVGVLAKHGIWNEPITGLILAALVAAVVGLGSGLVLLRTQGLTLLMLTLCTMALLEEAANIAHDYTGGFDGLDSLPIAPLLGVFEFNPLYPRTQYLYVLTVLFVCFVFVRTLVYSPFGQSLTGIRENTLRMHAVGAPVRGRLVLCYALSAAIAGVAGGIWAQANAYVNLGTLGLDRAATVLIILVLGGYGRLYGAFVGAIAYMALSHFLSKLYPTAWQLGASWGSPRRSRAALARRAPCDDPAPPRDPRALPQLRRAGRRARYQLPARDRRAPRPDRPERRRQDHVHQSADRRHPTDLGRYLHEGPGHHGRRPGRAGQARHRPDVPDQSTVSPALGAGKRLHRGRRAGRRRPSHVPAGRDASGRGRRVDASARHPEADSRRDSPHRKPEVLLLDEPAAGVPSAESHIILDAIDGLPRDIGVLIIDHDMDLVFRFAERITVLVSGAVFATGSPREIGADADVRAVYLGRAGHG